MEKSENNSKMEERTCPLPRFSEYNLEINKMGEIFRDARHYICSIIEDKCKSFVAELIIMRNADAKKGTDLDKELKKIPEIIFSGDIRSQDFMDALRDTFGKFYFSKFQKSFPMICQGYETITDDAREIIHLNNLLVAMLKGSSMANNFDNLARCMNYMSQDSGGKR
jgi:hypothetical protein